MEINSSFYRSHRLETYQRWAASTPPDFRFAVKVPKQITHENRLLDVGPQIEQLGMETSGLGDKLGAVLVQMPPSLEFDASVAASFFTTLKSHLGGAVVCEPRHPSWFNSQAESLLEELGVGRVAADPCVVPDAVSPGGCKSSIYFRWHGSPRMYYSMYGEQELSDLANRLVSLSTHAGNVWCIFDNTAAGYATQNALELSQMVTE